jgi:hypothetical protein
MKEENEYRRKLHALLDARTCVLSVIRQLKLDHRKVKPARLHQVIRQCASEVVSQRKPPQKERRYR